MFSQLSSLDWEDMQEWEATWRGKQFVPQSKDKDDEVKG